MEDIHLRMRRLKKGRSRAAYDYNTRSGSCALKDEASDLVAVIKTGLPSWAEADPRRFFEAADKWERQNGSAAVSIEAALPAELTVEQNIQMVKEFVSEQVPGKACVVAFHMGTAALTGLPQPHFHSLHSNRVMDGIDRPAERYFARANAKHPERGGCKKDSGGKHMGEMKAELKELRAAYAAKVNEHLVMNGHEAHVDHRSFAERGLPRMPERHLGQAKVRSMSAEERKTFVEQRGSPTANGYSR